MGVEALRFWFGASDYAHNEVVEDGEIGSRYTTTAQELRVEAQHSPVQSGLGALRGAVGVHWSYQNLRAQSFEGDGLLSPNHTNVIAGYWFEELEASPVLRFQAAARIEQNEVDGFGLLDPTAPAVRQFDRTFYPVSASSGRTLRSPDERRSTSHRPILRTCPPRGRTLLQRRTRSDGHVRDR